MRKTMFFVLTALLAIWVIGCQQSGTASSTPADSSEVSQVTSASTRQMTVELLKAAQALLSNKEYQDAVKKAKEAKELYGSAYSDNLNKTALNIILEAGRALGYQNRDYMRRNVFFSTDTQTISLNSKIRTFFNEYAAKNAFYRLPRFSGGEPDLRGLVLYAYAYYENPENNIAGTQVEAVAKKFFSGFSQNHHAVQNFSYAQGEYTPIDLSLNSELYCNLTSLSRRSEGGSALYTAVFDHYEYQEDSKNRLYLDSLKTQKEYAGMTAVDILAELLSEGKTDSLESSGSMTIEFEETDNGAELFFIIRSVQ